VGIRFMRAFCGDLIRLELDHVDDELRQRTCDWVIDRVHGAGDFTRLGLRIAACGIAIGVLILTRRPYERLPEQRRLRVASGLAGSRAPVVAELVRALRALAVSRVYEVRYPVTA
jgi:hypothetical protein